MKKFFVILTLVFSVITLVQAGELISDLNFKNIEASKDGSVLVLKINVPPKNAVSRAVLSEISAGLDFAQKDDSIGAIVITGSQEVFSAGAGGESLQKVKKEEETHSFLAHKVFNKIEAFPKPVIAAILGISAGGGNELALSCDIRIAGENAKFRQHELQAGLIPGFGGMQRLPRLVGQSRAMQMILTGRFVDAKEALSIGLVSSVFPDAQVLSRAIALAQQLNDNLDKKALAQFKKRMALSYNETYKTALRNDQLVFDKLATSPDIKEAIGKFIKRQKALREDK